MQGRKEEAWMNSRKPSKRPQDFDPQLREIFLIVGFLGSGFTTCKGAYEIFNQNWFVALAIGGFFQGLMYVIGRYLVKPSDRRHRRTLMLLAAWGALAAFSIYASALAMFQLQEESLKRDHARGSVTDQWNETARAIADFKTRAMTEMNSAKQAKNLEITGERNRFRSARAGHRQYSTETLQKLISELGVVTSAENRLQQVRLLNIALPDKTEDAQRTLGEALTSVNESYAALPEQVRSRVSLPRLPEAPQFPEHIQKAFWKELLSGSAPAILMVFFAAILDLLPPFVRFASSPKQTLDERVLGFRHWRRRLKWAVHSPLAADIESVKITIEEAPTLDIRISVPTSHGGPLLVIDRDFAEVTKEVCREAGREMVLDSVRTASGQPLVDGSPLLAQLGDGREVILSYASRVDTDFDSCSGEVN
jgi:hypothetical protein